MIGLGSAVMILGPLAFGLCLAAALDGYPQV